MMKKNRKRLSAQTLVETGMAETRDANLLRVNVDDWTVLLELSAQGKAQSSIERREGFTLVHFDLPAGPLGEYRINVQQPFINIQRSWVGKFHAWQGLELTSIALNFTFETSANHSLPVICNYTRAGQNRGVIGLLDHVPPTKINQRAVLDEPPMHLLQTQFKRSCKTGGFRETVVIGRDTKPFGDAIRRFMEFCRRGQGIEPLPAPDWARDPVWCSWYSHLYKLNQSQVEAQLPHLKAAGIRTLVIDASWFQSKDHDTGCSLEAGEYRMNTGFFPDFAGLVRRVHDAGMKIMLWCAPLFIGARAGNRAALAPYCTWDGTERSHILCPFCEESRAHARAVVERLMRDYGLDGLKLDFLDQLGHPCQDPKHDHGDGNCGAAAVAFLRDLRDGILGVKPDAAIEYRISYSNLVSAPLANCHRGNDAPYDADYMRRENSFLRLFCAYPSAVWSDYAYWHADEKPVNIALMLGGQIFSGGVPTLSIDFTQRSAAERRTIARWLAFYRLHRDALARSELTVHSADSILSVTSLQNTTEGKAFIFLGGQDVPATLALKPRIRRAWLLNASAQKTGQITVMAGRTSKRVRVSGPGPVEVTW